MLHTVAAAVLAAAATAAAPATLTAVVAAAAPAAPAVRDATAGMSRWNYGGGSLGDTFLAGQPVAPAAGARSSYRTSRSVTATDGTSVADADTAAMLLTSVWSTRDIGLYLPAPAPAAAGAYTLTLHFAETWATAAGVRRFHVSAAAADAAGAPVDGPPAIDVRDVDLFAAGGGQSHVAIDLSAPLMLPAGGGVTVWLRATAANNPTIQGATLAWRAEGASTATPTPAATATPTPAATATPTPTHTTTPTPSAAPTPTLTPTPTSSTNLPSWTALPDAPSTARRHENCFVNHQNRFFLIGGRSSDSTLVYDPSSASWTTAASLPSMGGGIHHMQCVSYGGLIVVVCAWTGTYPREQLLNRVLLFDPAADTWSQGDVIPPAHNRGSAAVVVRDGAIYIAAGNIGGHGSHSESSTLFTRYVPSTANEAASWTALAPCPRSRDHVYGVISQGQLVLAGGRDGGSSDPFNAVRTEIDVYSFEEDKWRTLPEARLAQGRGAPLVAAIGNTVIVAGGEGGGRVWPATEVLDMVSEQMVELSPAVFMVTGRHASPAVVCNGAAYVVAGSGGQGGGPELKSFEAFSVGPIVPCTS